MALAVAPTLSDLAVRLTSTASVLRGDGHTLVMLEGEQDIASSFALADSLAIAIALDDLDLIVDLSNVRFMGADTIGILIRARSFLREQSRTLTLRAPSAFAKRVLDLCEWRDPTPALKLVALPD